MRSTTSRPIDPRIIIANSSIDIVTARRMRSRFRAEQQTGYRVRGITSPGVYLVLPLTKTTPPPTCLRPKSRGTRAVAAYRRRLSDKRAAAK